MAGTRRLSELESSIGNRLRLPDGDLVIALSGGADSAALAYLCVRAGRTVRALHVHHGLPGSTLMEKASAAIAEQLALDLEVVNTEVKSGSSPEGQARRARYEAFSEVKAQALLTGHTRDDHVETVMLNIIRGTGPRGLSGIPRHRPPNIWRPMLAVERSETRELAGLARLRFVDDPMNEDPRLARNLLRRSLLPSLRQLNPKLDEAVMRLAELVRADDEYLQRLAAAVSVSRGSDSAAVPIGSLLAAPRPVASRVVAEMVSEQGAEPTADRVASVWAVVDEKAFSYQLGGGVTAGREGPMLVVSRRSDGDDGHVGDVVLLPGTLVSGDVEFDVTEHEAVCRALPLSKWAAVFPREVELVARADGVVTADGEPAWVPGKRRLPVAWYQPGAIGYLSVSAREKTGWTSSH